MDKAWKTLCVSHRLPTGRRLPTSSTAHQLQSFKSGKVKTISPAPALVYSTPVGTQATVTTAQELGLGNYEVRGWRGFDHHSTLSIAAYGFLVTERTSAGKPDGANKTPRSAKFLRFLRNTSLAAARRVQRHVSDSITTISYQRSFQLIKHLGQCPCCGRQNVRRRLRLSKTKKNRSAWISKNEAVLHLGANKEKIYSEAATLTLGST
jgi:hypothetical protein